jgi:NADH-quinone oxidoreductase subunit L
MFSSEIFHDVIDRTFVDGVVNQSGKISTALGAQIRKLQSGYIGFYLLSMVISIAVIFAYVFLVR